MGRRTLTTRAHQSGTGGAGRIAPPDASGETGRGPHNRVQSTHGATGGCETPRQITQSDGPEAQRDRLKRGRQHRSWRVRRRRVRQQVRQRVRQRVRRRQPEEQLEAAVQRAQ